MRISRTNQLHGGVRSTILCPLFCLVLLCPFVYVRMYVSVCSFAWFNFDLLALAGVHFL